MDLVGGNNEAIAVFQSYQEWLAEIQDKTKKMGKEITDFVVDNFNKRKPKIYKEFGVYQAQKVKELFNQAVDAFYNDYAPHDYSRTYGLYDLLDIKYNSSGTVYMDSDNMYEDLYNPEGLSGHRAEGRTLYQTVFAEGYHGGAAGISSDKASVWGHHPSPGIPYYRRAGMVTYPDGTKKMHRYGKWGNAAVKADISPLNVIYNNLLVKQNTEMRDKLREMALAELEEIDNQVVKEIVPDLAQKYFGGGVSIG